MTESKTHPSCPANIGSRERTKRILAGLFILMLSAVLIGLLNHFGLTRWWRIILIGPFYLAGLGIFQAQAATCIRLAAQGLRNLDNGPEAITNMSEIETLRKQAANVKLKSFSAAIFLTLLSIIF